MAFWKRHQSKTLLTVEDNRATTPEDLSVPLNTLGLHILNPDSDDVGQCTLDVVAVHGLGGDAFSTWTHASETMWLRDLLPKSQTLEKARILTFGYDATTFIKPFSKASNGRSLIFAEALLNDLSDHRATPQRRCRPIIFVGHSLGGIVIKSALCYAHARPALYGDIIRNTKCILFFGTPHQGSNVAVWATNLSKLTQALRIRSSKVTEELETWSLPLVDLTTSFSQLAPDFAISTFFETADTCGVRVVPEGSARLGQRNERTVGLSGNHLQICRFEDEADPNYRRVLKRFEAEAATILSGQLMSDTLTSASKLSPPPSNAASLEARLHALPKPQNEDLTSSNAEL